MVDVDFDRNGHRDDIGLWLGCSDVQAVRCDVKKWNSQPTESKWEAMFRMMLVAGHCPQMEEQYKFCLTRFWKLDFAHVETYTGVEIDGGEFMRKRGVKGGHNRGARMAADYEKRNMAAAQGWLIFQLTGSMVNLNGSYWVGIIKKTIEQRREGIWKEE